MADGSPNQRPEVVLGNLGMYLNTSALDEGQLQRAWCLGYVRCIWPTIGWTDALRVAAWLYSEADDG